MTKPENDGHSIGVTAEERVVLAAYQQAFSHQVVSIDDSFFDLGGASIEAVEIAAAISSGLALQFDGRLVYAHASPRKLAQALVNGNGVTGARSLESTNEDAHVAPNAPFPLSPSQERYWLDYPMQSEKSWSNISVSFDVAFPAVAGPPALQVAIDQLVAEHDMLRTAFCVIDGKPHQVVCPISTVPIHCLDLRAMSRADQDDRIQSFERGESSRLFDLDSAPLFRVSVVLKSDQEAKLVLVFHHLICDGWSISLFMSSLQARVQDVLAGVDRPRSRSIPFSASVVRDQRSLTVGDWSAAQTYWSDHLSGPLPGPFFPERRTELSAADTRGASARLRIPEPLMSSVRSLAAELETSPFAVMMAAFFVLLQRQSGRTDLIVGSPLMGRTHADARNQFGFFINLVLLRQSMSEAKSGRALIQEIHSRLLTSMAHQQYPTNQIAKDLGVESDEGTFSLTNMFMSTVKRAESCTTQVSQGVQHRVLPCDVRFEMMWYAVEYEDGTVLDCMYRSAMFERSEVSLFLTEFIDILSEWVRR